LSPKELMIMIYGNKELYGKSDAELIIELGGRFKQYRLQSRMTQKEVSYQSGVSIFTIRSFETGRATNITMGTFFALIRAIGFLEEAEKLLPEIPISPEILMQIYKDRPKRIKHKKNQNK